MKMRITIVFAVLVSLATCEWTCESCTAVVNTLAKHMTSEESIQSQVEILVPEICPMIPDVADDCAEILPGFWKRLALLIWPKYYDPQEDFMYGVTGLCGDPEKGLLTLDSLFCVKGVLLEFEQPRTCS